MPRPHGSDGTRLATRTVRRIEGFAERGSRRWRPPKNLCQPYGQSQLRSL